MKKANKMTSITNQISPMTYARIAGLLYARFPNGTGDFVIQPHTFNNSNSTSVPVVELEDIDILLYPNPAGDFITIESNQAVRQILLSDVMGKEITRKENPEFPLNVEDISSGIYFIRLDFDDQSFIVKIIKE